MPWQLVFFQAEKKFRQLCYEGKADISEFRRVLKQGVDLNVHDEVCTM